MADTTEVYRRNDGTGTVERELDQLSFDPSELYFGTHFNSEKDDTESSTTSTTYQEKLTLTTPSLDIDDEYIVFWYMEVKANLQNKIAAVRVQVDDTTDVLEVQHEGNEWVPITGFSIYTVTIAGTHDIDIDYRAVDGTAYIRRARLLGFQAQRP